jgi:hypothetical protein
LLAGSSLAEAGESSAACASLPDMHQVGINLTTGGPRRRQRAECGCTTVSRQREMLILCARIGFKP